MSQIKTILFDLGNVLMHIDFSSFWRELGFQRPEEIVPYTDGYKLFTTQYETGIISTATYLNGLKNLFNDKFTVDQLERAFASIIKDPVEGTGDLLERLSYTHNTAMVSNTNEIHYKTSTGRFDQISKIKKHYLSYLLHVMKPARGFYDAIINDQKMYPSSMLFIDDITENIKAAKFSGMNAIKFEGVDNLKETLHEFGII